MLISHISVVAQAPTIQWQKTYGSPSVDNGKCIRQTPDGGYIFAANISQGGRDVSLPAEPNNIWVVKINAVGAIEWEKNYGTSQIEDIKSIELTNDGGYIIAGNQEVLFHSSTHIDGFIIKLDALGNLVWEKKFGGSGNDEIGSIQQTNDGGLIVVGQTSSTNGNFIGNHGLTDVWVFKVDIQGNMLWQAIIGGSNQESGMAIKQTSDGGYIIAANTSSTDGDLNGNLFKGVWLVKLNSTGSISWQKCMSTDPSDFVQCIIQTSDGGYILGGTCRRLLLGTIQDMSNFLVMKTDMSGNLTWEKIVHISSTESCLNIYQTIDGGYVVGGYSNTRYLIGVYYGDFPIFKLSSTGTLLWQKTFGGIDRDNESFLAPTSDGGYILIGQTSSSNGDVFNNPYPGTPSDPQIWVVKLKPGVPFPVKLGSFTVTIDKDLVKCQWQTFQEINADHFEIERSLNGINFSFAGRVNAYGNTIQPKNYSFVDEGSRNMHGHIYYRLKMVDKDGSASFSTIEVVNKLKQAKICIYPNPAFNELYIDPNLSGDLSRVEVYNVLGKVVLRRSFESVSPNQPVLINISTLKKGTYFLSINNDRKSMTSFLKIQ